MTQPNLTLAGISPQDLARHRANQTSGRFPRLLSAAVKLYISRFYLLALSAPGMSEAEAAQTARWRTDVPVDNIEIVYQLGTEWLRQIGYELPGTTQPQPLTHELAISMPLLTAAQLHLYRQAYGLPRNRVGQAHYWSVQVLHQLLMWTNTDPALRVFAPDGLHPIARDDVARHYRRLGWIVLEPNPATIGLRP